MIKCLINNDSCLSVIIDIANACINLGYWASHFNMSLSIIILKSNKIYYDFPKFFYFIKLLNTLEKLIEKAIGERIQYHAIANNHVHSNQLRGLKQQFTSDVSNFLTHQIYSDWIKTFK